MLLCYAAMLCCYAMLYATGIKRCASPLPLLQAPSYVRVGVLVSTFRERQVLRIADATARQPTRIVAGCGQQPRKASRRGGTADHGGAEGWRRGLDSGDTTA